MKTYQMVPPDDGSRNAVSCNGRDYSSTPGVAIAVPSFDAPILQANGWQLFIASSSGGGTAVTQALRLNQLAIAAKNNNSIVKPKLIGSVPWAISTAYVLGQVVSNGGLAYICTTAGTSAASGGPTGRALNQTDNTAHWDYIGPQTAPVVTVNATTHNAALTNIYDLTQGQGATAGYKLPDLAGPARWRGGQPTVFSWPCAGTPSATVSPLAGNFDATRNMYYGAIEFIFEGTILEINMGYEPASDLVISVDGQYLDSTFALAANQHYHTLDFTNVQSSIGPQSGTGRQRRKILIECSGITFPYQLACKPTDSVSYASPEDNFSVAIIGDSQISGGGTEVNTRTQQMYSVQLMHRLGLPDMTHIGVGGTGFVAAGSSTQYIGHAVADLQALNTFREVGLIIIQSSQNDNGLGGIQAAALTLFKAVRAAFPSTIIIVTGVIPNSSTVLAQAQANETAVFAAVAQQQAAGDGLIFSLPIATDPAGPWLTGNGHVGAANNSGNADFDICSDGAHLSSQGHTYWAARLAPWIAKILAGINAPF